MIGILLSGGVDSTCLAYWKRPPVAITVDYGQKCAQSEINASKLICENLDIRHYIIESKLPLFGSGDLFNAAVNNNVKSFNNSEWLPFRNQYLITLAAMLALEIGIKKLLFGSVSGDQVRFSDGSEAFFFMINQLIKYQEGGLEIEAPALGITSEELIKISMIDSKLLSLTHSCHSSILPCNLCNGCRKRRELLID